MTFSLGLRAPRLRDLLARRVDDILETLPPDLFFRDASADRAAAGRPGEITRAQVQAAGQQIAELLAGSRDTEAWFGELVTEPREPPVLPDDADPLPATVRLDPAARLAWSVSDKGLSIYANGECDSAAPEIAPLLARLCAGDSIHCASLPSDQTRFLESQWRAGLLIDD